MRALGVAGINAGTIVPMNLPAVSDPVPLVLAEDGRVIRIAGTRVTLDTVIGAFKRGATPEEIAQDYSAVSLADWRGLMLRLAADEFRHAKAPGCARTVEGELLGARAQPKAQIQSLWRPDTARAIDPQPLASSSWSSRSRPARDVPPIAGKAHAKGTGSYPPGAEPHPTRPRRARLVLPHLNAAAMLSSYGGLSTPTSVTIAVISSAGVTSKAKFMAGVPSGATLVPKTSVTSAP